MAVLAILLVLLQVSSVGPKAVHADAEVWGQELEKNIVLVKLPTNMGAWDL